MAGPGHGYDPLLHYQPQSPFANQSYPLHNVSISTRPAMASGDAAKDTYNHNRNVIPGLGLGFASKGFDWQKQQKGTMQSQSHDTMIKPLVSGNDAPGEARDFLNLLRGGQERVTPDDQVEDGEVSEGDMADSSEPAELRNSVVTSRLLQDKNGNVFSTHVHGADKFNRASSITQSTARERSGSYSPYLSPHEIDRQEIAETPIGTFGHAARLKESSPGSRLPSEATQRHSQGSKSLLIQSVTEARKQAQDAILRLWPLNVRYQNYVDEGVDEELLKSLFKDLGFDIGLKTAATASKLGNAKSGKLADVSIKAKEGYVAPGKVPGTEKAVGKTQKQDKSEERKDRIARLLAAKTSKPSAFAPQSPQPPEPIHSPQRAQASQPSPPPHPSTESDSATTKHATQPLSQSEKSKLLHQKMEALRKAREARGQKRPHPEEPEPAAETPSLALASDVTPASSTTASADGAAQVKDAAKSHIPHNDRADASSSIDEQPSLPIPGLFLSSTPQPCSTLEAAPGRHSAPVTIEPDERPFKRPFGQMRGPRPFLIDVSDDEDDAEMEIDSPEHNPSTAYRPGSPSSKIMSKTALLSGENGLVRQYSSPIRTPTGMNGDGCTREDLESMHKKIEAMKQKILEAEARKKAKSSRPESAASTPSNSFAQGNSSESVESIAHITLPPPLSPAVTVPLMSPPPHQPVSESSSQTQELQNVANIQNLPVRRSLSRNASERLPLLEARRREQQLRLKLLQSQMAGIEKEIQESLQEEQRLKDDVESVGSLEEGEEEQEEEKQAPVPVSVESPALLHSPKMASQEAPSPVEAVEAMDTTSSSSPISDETRRSRLSTPGLAQEPSENQEMSTSGPSNLEDAANVEIASVLKSSLDVTDSTVTMKDNVDASTENKIPSTSVEAEEVGMEGDLSSQGDLEDASDSYEPPEADSSSPTSDPSRVLSPLNTIPAEQHIDEHDKDQPDTRGSSPQNQQISTAQDDTAPEMRREAETSKETMVPDDALTGFEDYETPLQQFHAYRFHPEYNKSIAGGLRSLTYSNKVDVKRELCPDDIAGRPCPRGKQCELQHFEAMQAPDDQILLQLGALGSFDEKQKQDYNTGLRQLLIDFRNNKVKDFQAISQGIIDYRARFLGDQSKILPLGNVTI